MVVMAAKRKTLYKTICFTYKLKTKLTETNPIVGDPKVGP